MAKRKIAEQARDRPLKIGDPRPDLVRQVQDALRAAGHELLSDGEFGAFTDGAVKRFQAASHLPIDGEVGFYTGTALDKVVEASRADAPPPAPLPSVRDAAPWLTWMRANTGLREIPGARSNPLILGWIHELAARWPRLGPNINWYRNDDTPWCGLGMAEAVGIGAGYAPPDAPLGAINWGPGGWKEGQRLKVPVVGAVMVFSRTGGNHVSCYEGQDATRYRIRGCNQSNMINETWIDKKRLKYVMWPRGHPVPEA